ncbi:serine/threonine protein kinase [Candidatus Synechococcus calcipolaris G9]|uniref:non-specific serine/threonine protein kinase n=1 Tax=Candidatus Synechococcus calcipolaris G9 TaxID=1497997 RepID=A0ABT6EYN0_9SYNE|nr:serine/threonine-protein kinase [Candidatus Synechococcus calcipolaris]MDG2990634.1 serine/threonine protein kinase [Candidatus Synechococcus calcipolaris G9]
MLVHCTHPTCDQPRNALPELDDPEERRSISQRFCTTCGMPLILKGHYVAEKLIGQGSFGAAYLARDLDTPSLRKCVLKQLRPNFTDPGDIATAQILFEREGAILGRLGEHPQIPSLFAFFDLDVETSSPHLGDRFFYLVQEYIDGKNLEDELEQQGRFREEEILQFLKELLPVLQFIHDCGSIHRDIKPSNIMLANQGRISGQSQLYLIDFGAVKQLAGTYLTKKSGHTGIYTPYFAPPEQMRGEQVYPSSDLYALAVTAIVLLTGKDAGELLDTYNDYWNWSSYVNVSDRLAKILNRMLESIPNRRYPSAQDVLEALSTPPPPPPLPPPPPTKLLWPIAIFLGIFCSIFALGMVAIFIPQIQQPTVPITTTQGDSNEIEALDKAIEQESSIPIATPSPTPTPTPTPSPSPSLSLKPTCGSQRTGPSHWWGVRGPGAALSTVQNNYCRDALIIAGQTQAASFTSKSAAQDFAEKLSRASGYGFYVTDSYWVD